MSDRRYRTRRKAGFLTAKGKRDLLAVAILIAAAGTAIITSAIV